MKHEVQPLNQGHRDLLAKILGFSSIHFYCFELKEKWVLRGEEYGESVLRLPTPLRRAELLSTLQSGNVPYLLLEYGTPAPATAASTLWEKLLPHPFASLAALWKQNPSVRVQLFPETWAEKLHPMWKAISELELALMTLPLCGLWLQKGELRFPVVFKQTQPAVPQNFHGSTAEEFKRWLGKDMPLLSLSPTEDFAQTGRLFYEVVNSQHSW